MANIPTVVMDIGAAKQCRTARTFHRRVRAEKNERRALPKKLDILIGSIQK